MKPLEIQTKETPSASERDLLVRIDSKMDRLVVDIDNLRDEARRAGALAGTISGGLAGGIVAISIALLRARMGF